MVFNISLRYICIAIVNVGISMGYRVQYISQLSGAIYLYSLYYGGNVGMGDGGSKQGSVRKG